MDREEDVDWIAFPGAIPYSKLASDSSASWSFVAQTLQKADATKVKDCKEDIDTLLVFAGLFSAVMTAFIVESYKLLLPDQGASAVDALGAISMQIKSYVITSQFANSTHVLAGDVPSSPLATNAIRVNALWFASLICSLVAASLGMLVKQWLREYLAIDYLSPQARVRVRQFRWQGLEQWRVFEIAALLPLLLQVALGLFFLGLCFFTLSINSVVGWTSTPLIIAWVTFFAFTVLAPAISAHCPFKTTFLKFALKSVRHLLRHHVSPLSEKHAHFAEGRSSPALLESSPISEKKPEEEEDALSNQSQDLSILLSFDEINSDDELLGTVIRRILMSTGRDGEEILSFSLKIIAHRLQRDVSSLPPSHYVPFLARRARIALVDILSDALCYEVQQRLFPQRHGRRTEHDNLSLWMYTSLQMIVALAGEIMQSSEAAAMAYCLMFDPRSFKDVMGDAKLTNDNLLTLLGVAQDSLRDCPGLSIMDFLRNTAQWYSNSMDTRELTTLSGVLRSSDPKLPDECLSAILGLLADTLHNQWKGEWEDWMSEAMDCLVGASDPTDGYYCVSALDKVCDLMVSMLTEHPYPASKVLEAITKKSPFDWHSRYWMLGLVLGRKLSKLEGGIPSMLRNWVAALASDYLQRLNHVRLCTVACNMASYVFAPEDIHTHRPQWHTLFVALAGKFTPNLDLTIADRLAIAHCLERIDVFDNMEATAPGVRKDDTHVESIVPDEFIEVLSNIVQDSSRRVDSLNRVSRLRSLREGDETTQTERQSLADSQSVDGFEDALEGPISNLSTLDSATLQSSRPPPVLSPRPYGGPGPVAATVNSPTIAPSMTVYQYGTSYDSDLPYPSIEDWLSSLDVDATRSRQHRLKYSVYAEALNRNGIYDLGDLARLRVMEPQHAIQRLQELGGMVYGIASRILEFVDVDIARRQGYQREMRGQATDANAEAA